MEGQVGNIFETNFRYTVKNNSVTNPAVSSATTSITKEEKQDSFESTTTKQKHVNHMLRNSAIVTGVGVAVIAPVVMLATKGKLPKPLTNLLNSASKSIAEIIQNLKEKPQMTKLETFYLRALQGVSKSFDSVKGLVFNFGPLKDVLFEKALRKCKLGKVCDKVTGFFEKMAIKMTSVAYNKSGDAFTLMKESFIQANKNILSSKNSSKIVEINGVRKTVAEWVKTAESKIGAIDSAYDTFRIPAIKKRYKNLSKDMTGLGDEVFDKTYGNLKKFITNPKKWTTFITEDIVAPTKRVFGNNLLFKKKNITNTHADVVKELNTLVTDIEKGLDMTSKDSIDILKRLRKTVALYKTDNLAQSENVKKEILTNLTGIIEDAKKTFDNPSNNYSILSAQKMKKSLGTMKHIVEIDKKGNVEELLNIYHHLLPKEEFKVLSKTVKKSTTALNDAVLTESDKLVDKVRDLKSGSALTDVGMSLLIPLGTTSVGLAMADTKEKKRSVLLNLGIPLLVGVATSVTCTVGMLTAGPSLILSLITGAVANRIGSKIDNNLKKRDVENLAMAKAHIDSLNQVENSKA